MRLLSAAALLPYLVLIFFVGAVPSQLIERIFGLKPITHLEKKKKNRAKPKRLVVLGLREGIGAAPSCVPAGSGIGAWDTGRED